MTTSRAIALKSTGPRSAVGKRRSATNAKRHGLSALLMSDESELQEERSLLAVDATRLGFSEQEARAVLAALCLGRAVFEAEHRAHQDKPESEKVELLTQEEDWIRSVCETQIPESQTRESDIQRVANLMFKQGHNIFSSAGCNEIRAPRFFATSSSLLIKSARPPASKNNEMKPGR